MVVAAAAAAMVSLAFNILLAARPKEQEGLACTGIQAGHRSDGEGVRKGSG